MLIDELRTAYDAQLRGVTPPGGSARIEKDGPLTRVVGWHRGFVTGPRDLGVCGAELDTLIARQRDFYAARGEAVEWKTRAHDLPADLTDRLTAAASSPRTARPCSSGSPQILPPIPSCPTA